jgi:amino acid transporter
LIAVYWAYDGWVYITWVAGEVKNPRRNVPLAMVLGVLVVGVIYVAMNVTYLYALPLSEVARHETIAHAAAAALFSPRVAVWLSLMIAVSCFSAAATCTLSGARVYLAMAQDGVFFKRMAVIHPKWRTPAFSLIGQGIWAAALTLSGRYDQLYTYVIFSMVLSYTLTVIGMFLLRWKRPEIPRPYRCTGIPVAARHLCPDRCRLAPEYNRQAPSRSLLEHRHRAGGSARIFVLEAKPQEAAIRVVQGSGPRPYDGSNFSYIPVLQYLGVVTTSA